MTRLQPDKAEVGNALAPFHHAAFAVLWTATVIGNTGTYMKCGFADQSHLCRVFRRITGQTPAAWRCNRRIA